MIGSKMFVVKVAPMMFLVSRYFRSLLNSFARETCQREFFSGWFEFESVFKVIQYPGPQQPIHAMCSSLWLLFHVAWGTRWHLQRCPFSLETTSLCHVCSPFWPPFSQPLPTSQLRTCSVWAKLNPKYIERRCQQEAREGNLLRTWPEIEIPCHFPTPLFLFT